jgi:hypothetical protein
VQRCWYVAYGSNMCRDRFDRYLEGGRPPGGRRHYRGARDPRPPADDRPYWLPGGTYFARESPTWTGGMAFLDTTMNGLAPARAYLLTLEQFADVVAQELRRDAWTVPDLSAVTASTILEMGPGHYETVVGCAPIEGVPAYTFTAPGSVDGAPLAAPSVAYLATVVRGLRETHGWSAREGVEHLVGRPGARGRWTVETALTALEAGR